MTPTPAWMIVPSGHGPVGADAPVRVGLFETSSDVRTCVARVDAQVTSLDRDLMTWAKKKYGPEGFAASVSAAELDAFRKDRDFYRAWATWRKGWESFKSDFGSGVSIMSADAYRKCKNFELEATAWGRRAKEYGAVVSAPPPVKDSPIPGILPPTEPGGTSWGTWATRLFWLGAVGLVGYFAAPLVLAFLATRKREAAPSAIGSAPAFSASSASDHIYVGPRRIHAGRIPAIYSIDGACCYVGDEQVLMALGLGEDDPGARQVTSLARGAAADVDLGASGTFRVRRMT